MLGLGGIMQLVLVRHGQSVWNEKNLFTGWEDVSLTEKGINEAKNAGKLLKEKGIDFDLAYTSLLKRAILTLWNILEQKDQCYLTTEKYWQLNERHYGDLQGKNKQQMRDEYGEEQVHIWRRSYSTPPPQTDKIKAPAYYTGLEYFPQGESIEQTVERVVPFWENTMKPQIDQGKKILVVAHGNSLRALIKHLEKISDDEIVKLEIPTGTPIEMKFNADNNTWKHQFI
jgi:2,3-bisphosphoglycerate-dependent phosphoglycerate mutase